MCDGEAIDIIDFFDGDVEVAIEDGNLRGSGYELDEGIH